MTTPALTVVLPVHNGMPYLEAALQSILRQTYADFRILAIDDGSTDGSGEYLDGVGDKRLSVLHQSCNGLGAVLNRGIDLCDTTFLARMDADDISVATRFEEQMAMLLRDSSLIAVGSPLDFLVHGTQQQGLIYPTEHGAIMADLLRGQSSLSHPTLLMRTAAATRDALSNRGCRRGPGFLSPPRGVWKDREPAHRTVSLSTSRSVCKYDETGRNRAGLLVRTTDGDAEKSRSARDLLYGFCGRVAETGLTSASANAIGLSQFRKIPTSPLGLGTARVCAECNEHFCFACASAPECGTTPVAETQRAALDAGTGHLVGNNEYC